MQMFNDSLPDCFPPVALSRPVGSGEIVLVTTPLLFTNYGMLDGDNAAYLFRLLSHLKGLPVVRTEAYGVGAQVEVSPFRYFLSQRPLRWALYLTMLVLVLFMVFTARRRQRAIPVIREPANRNLEFAELIGTLYYQRRIMLILCAKSLFTLLRACGGIFRWMWKMTVMTMPCLGGFPGKQGLMKKKSGICSVSSVP